MPHPLRTAALSRYERLLSHPDIELYLALDALGLHPSALALPAPASSSISPTPDIDIFAAFGLPPKSLHPQLSPCTCPHAPSATPPPIPCLSTPVLRTLLAAAGDADADADADADSYRPLPSAQQPPISHPLQHPTHLPSPAAVASSAQPPSPPPVFFGNPHPALSQLATAHASVRASTAAPRGPARVPSDEEGGPVRAHSAFRTARSRLPLKRTLRGGRGRAGLVRPGGLGGRRDVQAGPDSAAMAATRAVLGGAKRARVAGATEGGGGGDQGGRGEAGVPEVPNVDAKLVEMIMNEMLERSPGVEWDDIAGLHFAKRSVMEAVVWPMKRPDIFSGLRGPPKGLLLFGPPGTGKTLIGRAIASRSGAKFFNISASSLMSKWVGEGEKLVRALFAVARVFQPSVVFIDEIDSLLTQRTDGEQESSRRVKTEFLVQMDGAGTSREDRVLVVGATNRPQELDEAARRRLVKRLYIPLPDEDARRSLVRRLMQKQTNSLSDEDIQAVAKLSNGYSGSDMYALCAEAALGPVRELGESIGSVEVDHVRPVCKRDFEIAVRMVRASVSNSDLAGYLEWNATFGSFPSPDPTAAPLHDSDRS